MALLNFNSNLRRTLWYAIVILGILDCDVPYDVSGLAWIIQKKQNVEIYYQIDQNVKLFNISNWCFDIYAIIMYMKVYIFFIIFIYFHIFFFICKPFVYVLL